MPMKMGHSPEVVHANIKELVKAGHKPKQAIAIALANKRKSKKMAMGGVVDASDAKEMGNDDLNMHPDMSHEDGGSSVNNEQEQREVDDIARQGKFQEEAIANPAQQMSDKRLAMALAKAESEEMPGYAMGGLVEDGPAGDEPVGNKPSEDMSSESAEPMAVERMAEGGMGLSEEAMMALREKKKSRKYRV